MEVSTLTYSGGIGLQTRSSPLLRLQSDERLISLTRRGSAAAFETLVARYQARLLAFCRHLLGSREDAEDVLQDVFAAAYNAMVADDRPIAARPWLYRIARNRCLNHLRRIQPVTVDSMDIHLSEHGCSTADKVHARESFRLLVEDIHRLPETQRSALVLREMAALSYDQIAEAMETTVPSVKSLLVRARISLAEASEARQLGCLEVRHELAEVAEGLSRRPGTLVRRHVRNCGRCSAFERELKHNKKALSAFLPLGSLALLRKFTLLHLGHSAGTGSGAGGSAGVSGAGVSGATGTAGTAGVGGATATGATAGVGGATATGATAGVGGVAGATGSASIGGMAAGATGSMAAGASSSLISAGAGALATKAAATLAAAAIVSAGAIATTHHQTAPAAQPAPTAQKTPSSGQSSPAPAQTTTRPASTSPTATQPTTTPSQTTPTTPTTPTAPTTQTTPTTTPTSSGPPTQTTPTTTTTPTPPVAGTASDGSGTGSSGTTTPGSGTTVTGSSAGGTSGTGGTPAGGSSGSGSGSTPPSGPTSPGGGNSPVSGPAGTSAPTAPTSPVTGGPEGP